MESPKLAAIGESLASHPGTVLLFPLILVVSFANPFEQKSTNDRPSFSELNMSFCFAGELLSNHKGARAT